MSKPKTARAVIISSPGIGHLIPLTNFAVCLVENHGFSVTLIFFLTNHSLAEKSILSSLPKQINVISISEPSQTNDNISGKEVDNRVIFSVASNLTYIQNILKSLSSTPLSAIIVDMFGLDALGIAKELGVPMFLFTTTSAFALAIGIHLRDPEIEFQEPIRLPGCVAVHGRDFPDILQDRKSEAFKGFAGLMKKSTEVDGILLNSFEGLEKTAMDCLRAWESVPPAYPIGPLVRSRSAGSGDSEYLKWLDKQPISSVLYVSFGSGGTLSSEQMGELATGLELSGLRFFWVVRNPHHDANAAYFSDPSDINISEILPEGFVERTRNTGFVVPVWASQQEILGHASIGGFLTHSGWNSVLESVMNGVPMIAWPLYAEQPLNAVLLAEDLKVALRLRAGISGLVQREEIARVIKSLMDGAEGNVLRNKICDLRRKAICALCEGGASFKSMSEVVRKLKDPK